MTPPHPTTIDEICATLAALGYPELAQRIAYFASDADLDEGDVPVTLESAQGFWEFFNAVQSDGKLLTGCSSEGHICADWGFEDGRLVAIWFLDSQKVRFAASYAPGKWVEIDSGGEIGDRIKVTEKLVERGLFAWQPKHYVNKNLVPSAMLPDTADADK